MGWEGDSSPLDEGFGGGSGNAECGGAWGLGRGLEESALPTACVCARARVVGLCWSLDWPGDQQAD